MSQERFFERKTEFQKAVKRLEAAARLPADEFLRDAVIQRFEFCVELAWKALRMVLRQQGLETDTPRNALKAAFRANIIPTEAEGEAWLNMVEDRNLSSHTDNEPLAAEIHQRIVTDYLPLRRAMAVRLDTLPWD